MLTPKRAGERRDLGDHALAVGHRDAQLEQRGRRPGCPTGRLRRATRAPAPAARAGRVAVAGGDDGAHPGRARRGSASSAPTIASRLARQMSGQIAGWLAAMRVMSRNPPAASRSSTACSSFPALATFMSVDAASCGTWLTTATSASCCSGATAIASAPSSRDARRAPSANACGSVRPVGVSTHVAPTNRSALGAVEALLLRAGHRVTADEARRERRAAPRSTVGDDRRLHRADVGDERRARVERLDHDLGDVARPAPRRPRGRRRPPRRRRRRRPRRPRPAPRRPWRRARRRGRSRARRRPRGASASPIEPPIRPVPISATRLRSGRRWTPTQSASARSSRSAAAPSRYTWCSSSRDRSV